jgi:hypothetical protein
MKRFKVTVRTVDGIMRFTRSSKHGAARTLTLLWIEFPQAKRIEVEEIALMVGVAL